MLQQDLATEPGRDYHLTFFWEARGSSEVKQSLKVRIVNDPAGENKLVTPAETFMQVAIGLSDISPETWTQQTIEFTARSTTTRISFINVSKATDAADLWLDHISVIAAEAEQ